MGKFIDLTGKKFDRLTVIERTNDYIVPKTGKHQAQWKCQCECGNFTNVSSSDLNSGHTKSCGCHKTTKLTSFSAKHGLCQRTNRHPLTVVWNSMKKRCYNSSNSHYKDYGGRGITVCDEWKNDFQTFFDWAMANGYSTNLEIDRIDVNGNYEPSNCRWVTILEQAKNKRNTLRAEFNGEMMTLTEIANITGIPYNSLRNRLKRNFPLLERRRGNIFY